MSLKNEEKAIDGIRLDTTQLPPMRAFVLSKKLLPIVAPVFVANGDIASVDLGGFADALGRLSDEEATRLVLQTFASTAAIVDGERHELDSEALVNRVFAGAFPTMLKTLWWVIGFNFFPSGVGDLLAGPKA